MQVDKPMRLMTREEKIVEFERRIADNLEFQGTPHGDAYLNIVRDQLRRVQAS